jgi:hypothetical protein
VGQGLEALHFKGLVHGHMEPSIVLVGTDGSMKMGVKVHTFCYSEALLFVDAVRL